MAERLQILLLISLTILGLVCLVGIIVLEMSGHTTVGVLSAMIGAVVMALSGLMTRWGESLKPQLARIEAVQTAQSVALTDNTAKTETVAKLVNGHTDRMEKKITSLEEQLAEALKVKNKDNA